MTDPGVASYERFLHGDDGGFEDIVRAYREGLILFILGYVGDAFAAEDISQDVFVKLYVKRPKFRPDASFKTWLYTIAKREAQNYIKKRRRERGTDEGIPDDGDEGTEDAVSELVGDERRRALHRALSELNDDYRAVLYLLYFEYMTPREASSVMGRSPRQIHDLIYRAKSSLRAVIERGGEKYEILRDIY